MSLPSNNMAVSGFDCRKALVSTERAISVRFCINGLGNKLSHLALHKKGPFFSYARLAFPDSLSLLIGGNGYSHIPA